MVEYLLPGINYIDQKIYEEILLNGINKGLFFLVIYEGGNLLEIRKIIKSN